MNGRFTLRRNEIEIEIKHAPRPMTTTRTNERDVRRDAEERKRRRRTWTVAAAVVGATLAVAASGSSNFQRVLNAKLRDAVTTPTTTSYAPGARSRVRSVSEARFVRSANAATKRMERRRARVRRKEEKRERRRAARARAKGEEDVAGNEEKDDDDDGEVGGKIDVDETTAMNGDTVFSLDDDEAKAWGEMLRDSAKQRRR